MNIHQALIFPLQGSGSGFYTDNLSEFLLRRGHDVRVFCVDHAPPRRPYPVEALLCDPAGGPADLPFDFPVFMSHPLSRGATFGGLSDGQRAAYIGAFRSRLAAALLRSAPDIVHVHHGWVPGAVVAELGLPYVVSLHGTEHYGFGAFPAYRELALKAMRGARRIVALSEEHRDQAILAYGVDPQRVVVIRSGTDTATFRPLPLDPAEVLGRYGVAHGGRPVVLFAGRLTAIKGVDVLLRAAAIYERGPGAPLTLIAGEGDARPALEAQARSLGLRHVHFLGQQTRQQLVPLLNIADVAALPSRMDAFPLVAMEALACGTPLVASDIGGFRQIVPEGAGALVAVEDHRGLAAAVAGLLGPGRAAHTRALATAHIRANFSWDATVDAFERLYAEVVAEAAPAVRIAA